MPLNGFKSLCDEHAPQIISKDKKNPQYHRGINTERAHVTHYQIDGVVIQTGSRCDYLLINESANRAYLIELKGSDLVKAAEQLEATENALQRELSGYSVFYRIVANKCKTQEIKSSSFRRYQMRWKGKLVQKTGCIEENI